MPFDHTKPFQTRDGRKARLLADDIASTQPLVVSVTVYEGYENVSQHGLDGSFMLKAGEENDRDLVNTPEVRVAYVNYYGDGEPAWEHASPSNFDFAAANNKPMVACFKLTYTGDKVTAVELVRDEK